MAMAPLVPCGKWGEVEAWPLIAEADERVVWDKHTQAVRVAGWSITDPIVQAATEGQTVCMQPPS